MISLNPIQQKRKEVMNNISKGFVEANQKTVVTPDNPVGDHRQFVSNNIVKSMDSGEEINLSKCEVYTSAGLQQYKDDLRKSYDAEELTWDEWQGHLRSANTLKKANVEVNGTSGAIFYREITKVDMHTDKNPLKEEKLEKGEISDKLGSGYGGNEALKFTKSGKDLKAILPVTIANLKGKRTVLEATMKTLIEAAGCQPSESYGSYNFKSVTVNRFPWDLCRSPYDEMNKCYPALSDEQKACGQYNDLCYQWCSISEDILACSVIMKNLEDSKKYTLSVSQLVALSSGDEDMMKGQKTDELGAEEGEEL